MTTRQKEGPEVWVTRWRYRDWRFRWTPPPVGYERTVDGLAVGSCLSVLVEAEVDNYGDQKNCMAMTPTDTLNATHNFERVPEDVLDDEQRFVAFLLECSLKVEAHEAMERARYGGEMVFDPHRRMRETGDVQCAWIPRPPDLSTRRTDPKKPKDPFRLTKRSEKEAV